MATFTFENFANFLRDKNYKPSTINLYVSQLKRCGVDLHDRGRVHEVVSGHIFDDLNGHTYRSLRLFDCYVNKKPVKRMPERKKRNPITIREACLGLTRRADIRQAWWLMRSQGYAPSTAVFYVHSSGKIDKNKNGRRARMALQNFRPIEINDPVVLNHYNNLYV